MSDHEKRETGDETTIDEALRLMRPTPHVGDEVKAALASELPGISGSITEIAQMSPLRLASRLIGLEGVAEDDLMDIARELIASFKAMLGLDAAPAPTPGPVNVTVALEKRLDELTPRELLTRLAGDPSQFDDIATALRATRLVLQAGQNPWAIPGAGGLDVTRTMEYLEYLSRPGSIPQRLWPARGGARPETLESLFGHEVRLMINPFTGQQFSGLDEWGNDWNALPETVHLAMLWAVAASHRNLPSALDARRLTDDLFAQTRPAYMQEIVEDFEEARRHDPQLASMSRYFTEETAAGRPAPRRTEEDYLNLLLNVAQAHRGAMGGDIRLGEVVIQSFKTLGGDVVLRDTIVLRNSGTSGGSLYGTAYVPRGVRISTLGGNDRLNVYEKSYEDLARRAGLV
jgi:hypothetical protein